jgi:cob(I)alamin adenosyltransferase
MVKIIKVYTRTGDKGETGLAGGHRVSKKSLRIISLGILDELNANIGLVIAMMQVKKNLQELLTKFIAKQHEIFNLGAQLAVLPEDRRECTPIVNSKTIKILEQEIDTMNTVLPILNSFVLPGGSEISAMIHIARSVCRRAEISLVDLMQSSELEPEILSYINRLSDWLFVVARYVNFKLNEEEVLWNPKII